MKRNQSFVAKAEPELITQCITKIEAIISLKENKDLGDLFRLEEKEIRIRTQYDVMSIENRRVH